jgi:hypothetical protein
MKKTDLQQLIKEEIKKTLSEMDRDPLIALKSGDYNGVDEFVELWKERFKLNNQLTLKKTAFEFKLGRPLTDEEYQALNDAGLMSVDSTQSRFFSPSQEDHYDLVRDLKSALGKGNALRTVSNYLGRMLSKSEIRALISSGVINPRVVK